MKSEKFNASLQSSLRKVCKLNWLLVVVVIVLVVVSVVVVVVVAVTVIVAVKGIWVVYCRHSLPFFEFAVAVSQQVRTSPLAATDVLCFSTACTIFSWRLLLRSTGCSRCSLWLHRLPWLDKRFQGAPAPPKAPSGSSDPFGMCCCNLSASTCTWSAFTWLSTASNAKCFEFLG